METMLKREMAQIILANNHLSDDMKLYKVFELYKDELKEDYSQLYYALLGWKDAHLSELFRKENKGDQS